MFIQNYDFLQCTYTADETEKYLHEVIKCRYDVINTTQILEALTIARRAHEKQFRDNNDPYIIHPMRVALMLARFDPQATAKVFIAALLHDTVEKKCLTITEIEQQFGKYVAKLVQSVTRPHGSTNLQEKREAKKRKWLEIMGSSHEVRAIKTFEDLDNVISWKTISKQNPAINKIPRWLNEVQEMSIHLAEATNKEAYNLMRKEIDYYVNQGYGNQPITR